MSSDFPLLPTQLPSGRCTSRPSCCDPSPAVLATQNTGDEVRVPDAAQLFHRLSPGEHAHYPTHPGVASSQQIQHRIPDLDHPTQIRSRLGLCCPEDHSVQGSNPHIYAWTTLKPQVWETQARSNPASILYPMQARSQGGNPAHLPENWVLSRRQRPVPQSNVAMARCQISSGSAS